VLFRSRENVYATVTRCHCPAVMVQFDTCSQITLPAESYVESTSVLASLMQAVYPSPEAARNEYLHPPRRESVMPIAQTETWIHVPHSQHHAIESAPSHRHRDCTHRHGSSEPSARSSMQTHIATENPVLCGHRFIAGTTIDEFTPVK
jgi:hypothetical protein